MYMYTSNKIPVRCFLLLSLTYRYAAAAAVAGARARFPARPPLTRTFLVHANNRPDFQGQPSAFAPDGLLRHRSRGAGGGGGRELVPLLRARVQQPGDAHV